jgi:glutathione S-transferase
MIGRFPAIEGAADIEGVSVPGLRVYHRARAGRPIRVVWALEEAGVPYELTVLTHEQSASAEHRERHPLGRVPVIETGPLTLFESSAVCLYVADLRPGAGLIPAPQSPLRALVYQWMFFAMTEIEPRLVEMHRLRESAPEVVQSVRVRVADALAAVESQLDGHPYLLGESFTVADIVLGGVVLLGARMGIELAPHTTAYLQRLRERPAYRRARERLEQAEG